MCCNCKVSERSCFFFVDGVFFDWSVIFFEYNYFYYDCLCECFVMFFSVGVFLYFNIFFFMMLNCLNFVIECL